MAERSIPWQPTLAPAWLEWAQAALKRKWIKELDYHKETRKRLLNTLADEYWKSLIVHAVKKGSSLEDIGRRLGFERGTYNRWVAEKERPDQTVFFGGVLVLREELKNIPFPMNRELAWSAASAAITQASTVELEKVPHDFHHEDWRCVRRFVRHPQSFLPKSEASALSDATAFQVLGDVVNWNLLTGRAQAITDEKKLYALVRRWAKPYALFRVGLLDGLEVFDDPT